MLSYKEAKSNQEQLTKVAKKEGHKYKVFFFSAPYDKSNTGDGDFVNAMIKANQSIGVPSTWIQGNNTLQNGSGLYNSDNPLFKKLSKEGARDFVDPTNFAQLIEEVNKNSDRQDYVKNIIKYIKENTPPDTTPIFAMQFRPPETGCLLVPEDLKQIKAAGIQINMTVHEYGLNYTRPHLQAYSHEFFKEADHINFLNKQDQEAAVESSKCGKLYDSEGAVEKFSVAKLSKELDITPYPLEKKSSFTQVPPTVAASEDTIEQSLQREPNISWFGMIRPWKGIEEIVGLADLLQAKQLLGTEEEKELLKGAKVIVAGMPAVNRTMIDLFKTAFRLSFSEVAELTEKTTDLAKVHGDPPSPWWTAWWREKLMELNSQNRPDLPPVEIYLDVTTKENIELHSRCLYAYKPDSKGLAGNSSSIISEVAQKCITITKWGYCTPEQFLKNGPYEGALILSKHLHGVENPDRNDPYYKQGVGSPAPDEVLHEILTRQKNYKECVESSNAKDSKNYQSLARAEKALNEFFDPTVIALQNANSFMPELGLVLAKKSMPEEKRVGSLSYSFGQETMEPQLTQQHKQKTSQGHKKARTLKKST